MTDEQVVHLHPQEDVDEADELVRETYEVAETLADYDGAELDIRITAASKSLGVPKATLTKAVKEIKEDREAERVRLAEEANEPVWSDPVDGEELFDDIFNTFKRYLVTEDRYITILTLWAAHTHCYGLWRRTPRLNISSPTPDAGKDIAINLLVTAVARPEQSVSHTQSAMMRAINARSPTLFLDEADQWLHTAKGAYNVLHGGWQRGKTISRTVKNEDVEFNVFSPVVLIGIGSPKSNPLRTRSVEVHMVRKLATDECEPLGDDDLLERQEFVELRQRLERWVYDHKDQFRECEHEVNQHIGTNRFSDNWRPLYSIAYVAGEKWRLRAATALAAAADEDNDHNEGERLLRDIYKVWEGDRMFTADLIEALCQHDEIWLHHFPQGERAASMKLAKLIRDFGQRNIPIKSTTIRQPGKKNKRGYYRHQFEDAWRRYCHITPEVDTSLQTAENLTEDVATCNDNSTKGVTNNTKESADCNNVTTSEPPTSQSLIRNHDKYREKWIGS